MPQEFSFLSLSASQLAEIFSPFSHSTQKEKKKKSLLVSCTVSVSCLKTQYAQPYRKLPALRGLLRVISQQDYLVTKWNESLTHLPKKSSSSLHRNARPIVRQ